MTARLLLSCDGHRHGQSCRAFWTGSLVQLGGTLPAVLTAREQGWTTDGDHHYCPSGVHDGNGTPNPLPLFSEATG